MSVKECVVCAWRATCALKFKYQSSELHCREYTRDITFGAPEKEPEEDAGTDEDTEEKPKAE